jgi:hypothetical protein
MTRRIIACIMAFVFASIPLQPLQHICISLRARLQAKYSVQDKRKDLTSVTPGASEDLTETHQAFMVQPPEAGIAELTTGDATISTLDNIAAPTDWEKPRML